MSKVVHEDVEAAGGGVLGARVNSVNEHSGVMVVMEEDERSFPQNYEHRVAKLDDLRKGESETPEGRHVIWMARVTECFVKPLDVHRSEGVHGESQRG